METRPWHHPKPPVSRTLTIASFLTSFLFSFLLFLQENVTDCLKGNFNHTMKLLLPLIGIFALFFAHVCFLESYQSSRALTILLFNFVLSIVTLDLMLHNMTKKAYSLLSPFLLMLVAPLAVNLVKPEIETKVTMVCTVLALFVFYARMTILTT
jgi:hypothetical protein